MNDTYNPYFNVSFQDYSSTTESNLYLYQENHV